MQFVHIADVHFDMPFKALSKKDLSEKRRLDIIENFKKVINYIKDNRIEYLFISGDLYENEYVRKSTIDYINKCFTEIPDTKILITPGNHDPYLINSYYSKYEWNENVHIFTDFEKITYSNINIYGYGFTDFYNSKIDISNVEDESKLNILIMHADLNGSGQEYGEYNPILESDLEKKGYDYVALGHIHKNNFDKTKRIIYPGSLNACGFDELGKHGMIVGTIDEDTKNIELEFIEIDSKQYTEIEIDISTFSSLEEIAEKIEYIKFDENKYYKIILTGTKKLEIDENSIMKYIKKSNILKIKDHSKYEYDLEKIANEQTLKGIFVKELLSNMTDDNKEEILQSIYLGLEAMQ